MGGTIRFPKVYFQHLFGHCDAGSTLGSSEFLPRRWTRGVYTKTVLPKAYG